MTDWLPSWFEWLNGWLFGTIVAPLLYQLGLATWIEPAIDATEGFTIGLLEIALAIVLIGPLEWLMPVTRYDRADRPSIRTDILYTFLQRVGLLPLIFFFLFLPLQNSIEETMRAYDLTPIQLDQMIPALADWPLGTFLLYLLALDLAQYWFHRAQHQFRWWWALHALHHDQRQMTFWSDDRNHLLDSALDYLWVVTIALVIGVEPAQFLPVTIAGRLIESLSHVNARIAFGRLGERLLVSPRYHRRHHAVIESGAQRGCNFAVLFPVWDMIFGTADFTSGFPETGITEPAYHPGLLHQQWEGLRRVVTALRVAAPR